MPKVHIFLIIVFTFLTYESKTTYTYSLQFTSKYVKRSVVSPQRKEYGKNYLKKPFRLAPRTGPEWEKVHKYVLYL